MSAAVLVAVAGIAYALGTWSALIVTTVATKRRPAATCLLASVPTDLTEPMAAALAAEVSPEKARPRTTVDKTSPGSQGAHQPD